MERLVQEYLIWSQYADNGNHRPLLKLKHHVMIIAENCPAPGPEFIKLLSEQ